MILLPITTRAWSRLKLTIAEWLVLGAFAPALNIDDARRNIHLITIADSIKDAKNLYYPAKETKR